ncbi:tautomerase family protein [Paenibacillus alvei]|uniref:tautomerase family protein n=1 Tax=Paenibacillus alvei TaxID=44250 RepID=UPI0013DBE869|nr:4-oxalocrotonate tautomerase [Paenibacillus alvei]
MPFIRVSYMEGQYDTCQLEQISKTIMYALIKHFNVPEDDCFQVFHAHRAGEFFYSKNYLNVERSEGLLYIQITLKSGRTEQQKTGFYAMLAKELSNTVNIRKEDVFVVLVDNEFDDWSFGNGIAQMLDRQKKRGGMAHRAIKPHASESLRKLAPAFIDYSENVLFGDLWRREQLSLRDRSLVTISALVAGGLTEQLSYHLRLSVENGLQQEEIVETITHLAYYAGWPRAASALQVVETVFENKA